MHDPSLKEIRAYLKTVTLEEDQVDEQALIDNQSALDDYVQNHGQRLWRSLQLVRDLVTPGKTCKILELGAAPYFFTALLLRYVDCEITGVNVRAGVWPGAAGTTAERARVRLRHGSGSSASIDDIDIYIYNIEKDPFPFPDDSFDVVLCMETIEHLIYSPSHMLAETGRLLRPGGTVLLSTPNAINLNNTIRMIKNHSIAFYYSGYGPYGRHNREYTADELRQLVTACGFHVKNIWLENPYFRFQAWPLRKLIASLVYSSTNLPLPYLRHKREYIYVLAESSEQIRLTYPEKFYLYRNLYPDKIHNDR
jgi:SAM-dependent methyltransferase